MCTYMLGWVANIAETTSHRKQILKQRESQLQALPVSIVKGLSIGNLCLPCQGSMYGYDVPSLSWVVHVCIGEMCFHCYGLLLLPMGMMYLLCHGLFMSVSVRCAFSVMGCSYCPWVTCTFSVMGCSYTQRRVQPDQCYFTVQITGINFECSL